MQPQSRNPTSKPSQHRSTRLTLATREFETAVRVEAKDDVADGVVALTLRAEVDGHPYRGGSPAPTST